MNVQETISLYARGLTHLFFPNMCQSCNAPLLGNEQVICSSCEYLLPKTDFHTYANNPVEKKLWGRIRTQQAASFLFFEKGLLVQHLFKQMKYHQRKDVGTLLGSLYGKELSRDKAPCTKADCIIPVPLHPRKKRQRGYNQVDSIAEGLSTSLRIPWKDKVLKRTKHTLSQTGKNRGKRWENVHGIFEVNHPQKIKNKHILLVDDVITTGATLEACANALLSVEGTTLSILTLACAV